MSLDAVESNESMRAGHPDCEYFQLRDGHHEMLEALENRIDTITFEIDADLVAEPNRMWWRRFIIGYFVLYLIYILFFIFWWVL